MAPDFSVNHNPDIQIATIGDEKFPVIVVDNLMLHPEDLLLYAGNGADFQQQPGDYYPGIKKPLPEIYAENIAAVSTPLLRKIFHLDREKQYGIGVSALSITTTRPEDLLPIQSVPHFDSSNPNQFAIVHYLCQPEFGGTSFYRHRQTGYESVDPSRYSHYTRTLERQATTVGLPTPEYINGDTPLFVQIASFSAKFNRALIYHSNCLHSGNIRTEMGLSRHPRHGRLTATSSLIYSV